MVIAAPGASRYEANVLHEDSEGSSGNSNADDRGKAVELINDEEAPLTLRQKIWALFDDPGSSRAANMVAIIIMGLIGISCTTFCLETLPSLRTVPRSTWNTIEAVCVIIFTVEFVFRIGSCPDIKKFCASALNIIDFVAIVPFYIELAFGNDTDQLDAQDDGGSSAVIRILRLVRVFRVFKISRYMTWMTIFGKSMAESVSPLSMFVFIIVIGMVFFSAIMYFFEKGKWDPVRQNYFREDGKVSPFASIPDAFWWCIVTMTTVGYGDAVPLSTPGMFLAGLTSLAGILVLAIPITVISSNFDYQYNKVKQSQKIARARMKLLKDHFKRKKGGIDAIQDEIEAMVKHSTEDLMQDIEALMREAQEDLAVQAKEIVRLAYAERRSDLRRSSSSLTSPANKIIEGTLKKMVSPVNLTKVIPFARRFSTSSSKILPTNAAGDNGRRATMM